MKIEALLVGVSEYSKQELDLKGCTNDVDRMKNVLIDRYKNINCTTLLNEEARRKTIIEKIENFSEIMKAGDTFLFYFSGHGSQENIEPKYRDIEPDLLNETIVCHDSRGNNGVGDLTDKEVSYLLSKFHEDIEVVVIYDSCHSGNGTRVIEEEERKGIRAVPGLGSIHDFKDYCFAEDAKRDGWNDDLTKVPKRDHVFISACQSYESAIEKPFPPSETYGVFTYYLAQVLEEARGKISYYNLRNHLENKIRQQNLYQNPSLESFNIDSNKKFLGDSLEKKKLILAYVDEEWKIKVGTINGYLKEDIVSVYPEFDKIEGVIPIVRLKIESLGTAYSIVSSSTKIDKNKSYQVSIEKQNHRPLVIEFIGSDMGQIRDILNESYPYFLEEGDSALYYVKAIGSQKYTIFDKSNKPLFIEKSAEEVLKELKRYSLWYQKLNINNFDESLNNMLDFSVRYKDISSSDGSLDVVYDKIYEKCEDDIRIHYKVKVSSQSVDGKFYILLLIFDKYNHKIYKLFKQASLNELKLSQNHNSEENSMCFRITADDIKMGIFSKIDYFKLFVCKESFNSSILIGDFKSEKSLGIKNSFEDSIFSIHHSRSPERETEEIRPVSWITKNIILRTSYNPPIKLSSYSKTVIQNRVTVQPHPLNATITLLSNKKIQEEGKKSAPRRRSQIPTILEKQLGSSPYTLLEEENHSENVSIITLDDVDKDSIGFVTSDNPLSIQIENGAIENDEIVIPYSFDGEHYIPLGHAKNRSNDLDIYITSLPKPSNYGTRSVSGSIKIYFHKIKNKLLGHEEEISWIAMPTKFDNEMNVIRYEKDIGVIKDKVKEAETIVLFIHGIIGDTQGMAGAVSSSIEGEARAISKLYDCVLTFDYENLNTPIEEIANELKEKLEELGLENADNKRLDIVTHSMGGLVSRYMIEKLDSDLVIDRLVMFGTPNGGSPYADVKDMALNSLTALLNGLTTTSLGMLTVAGLMKLLDSIDNTLDQMDEDSALLDELFSSPSPSTAYYLIAGDNSISKGSDTPKATIFNKIKEKINIGSFLTKYIFEEKNDMAVAISSMEHFPTDWKDEVNIIEVDCDHLSYFKDDASLTILYKFLKG